MVKVGMLHYRKHPSTVYKAYAYAAAAKIEGVDFFYFSPGNVDLDKKTIEGYFYLNGEWTLKETSYPEVIYNAGSAQTEKQDKIFNALKEIIPFTSYSIGDKMSVYNRLKDGDFKQYLIPSEEIMHTKQVFNLMKRYKKVIVKPIAGSKGDQVMLITPTNSDYYLVNAQKMSKTALIKMINKMIQDRVYLVQVFINSTTIDGDACDYRLHTQKNGDGEWVLTTIYPRIAKRGVVVNISTGGYTTQFDNFLEDNYGLEAYNMKQYLEQFALRFSSYFDSLYDESLDELGIDIGIDQDKKLWIFEVNWRPGQPVLYNLDISVARNTILYAVYLANKNQK